MAIINTASCGKFSSDRTIEEYVNDMWHLEKVEIPAPAAKKSVAEADAEKAPAEKVPAAKATAEKTPAAKRK